MILKACRKCKRYEEKKSNSAWRLKHSEVMKGESMAVLRANLVAEQGSRKGFPVDDCASVASTNVNWRKFIPSGFSLGIRGIVRIMMRNS